MNVKDYIKYRTLLENRYFMFPDGPEATRTLKVGINPFVVDLVQSGNDFNVGWRRKDGVSDNFELLNLKPIKAG